MDIIVIGSGPAGLTAAYELTKRGHRVRVYEASDQIGGMARSFELWGQRVDVGPHRFFSDDARVNRLWLEVVQRDYRMVERLTRILYKKRFFAYPLRAFNALRNMGLAHATLCMLSYLKERVRPSYPEDASTFEAWVVRRFGRRLFEMFFKSYSEKLWGISCQELDADFAAQRIKKFSLGAALKAAIGFEKKRHKTLVDSFAFPVEGSGMVYERMADFISAKGGKIHLNTPVRRVVTAGKRAIGIELADSTMVKCDHVISTMPFTLMAQRLEDNCPETVEQAVSALRYRNTLIVYLKVDHPDLFPDQWLYVHSPELKLGRICNFRNWVPELYGEHKETILALEYWCDDSDEFWRRPDAELVELGKRELEVTGLADASLVSDGHVLRISRSYPVYETGYREKLQVVVDYLEEFDNVTAIGRYGSFKYNNQDHSILMGLLAAENIADGCQHDLWAVNTDYESYQEEATIDATGLNTREEERPVPALVPVVEESPEVELDKAA